MRQGSLRDSRTAQLALRFLPFGLAAINMATLLSMTSRLWFLSEDFYFALDRPLQFRAVFYPNGEHMTASTVLVYRVFFALFGLRSFPVWMIPVTLYHVALIVVIAKGTTRDWRIRHVIVTIIFGWYGPGNLNFIWPFQFTFIAAFFWGVVVLRRITRRHLGELPTSAVSWLADAGLLLFGITHSSATFLVLPAYLLVAVGSKNRRFAVSGGVTIAAALIPYLIWYAHFRKEISGATARSSIGETLLSTPEALVESLGRAGSGIVGLAYSSSAGPTVGLAFAATVLILTLSRYHITTLATSLMITLVTSIVVTNYSRRALLGKTPATEHYIYLWSALLLAICCCIGPDLIRQFRSKAPGHLLPIAACGILLAGSANLVSLRRTVITRTQFLNSAMCAYGVSGQDQDGAKLAVDLNYPAIGNGRLTPLIAAEKITDARLVGDRRGCRADRSGR